MFTKIHIIKQSINKKKFGRLYYELRKNGFYCLIADKKEDVYKQLAENLAVRFAKKGYVIPNIELKFPKNPLDTRALQENITVILPFGKLIISEIEQQIAFKRYFLKSEKDIEYAMHLENIFKDLMKKERLKIAGR